MLSVCFRTCKLFRETSVGMYINILMNLLPHARIKMVMEVEEVAPGS